LSFLSGWNGISGNKVEIHGSLPQWGLPDFSTKIIEILSNIEI
jgi:hypothetical protein